MTWCARIARAVTFGSLLVAGCGETSPETVAPVVSMPAVLAGSTNNAQTLGGAAPAAVQPGSGGAISGASGAGTGVSAGGVASLPPAVGTGSGQGGMGSTPEGIAGQTTAGDMGGMGEVGGTPAPRPLAVTAPPDLYVHAFQPTDADPLASDNGQVNGTQRAALDTRVPLLGKLVVDMGSSGGVYSEWFPVRGFHFLAADFMGVNEVPSIVGRDADFYGDLRLEALVGEDLVPDIDVDYHDSFEGHVTEGLKYLQLYFPEQDWGYYLNEDGSVRWSDVIVTGRSHGASSAPRFAKVRRLARVVSRSGPRDNTCGTDPNCAGGIVASWFSEESATPIDRFYSISGQQDSQHPEIQFAVNLLGYLGDPVNVEEVAPPYEESHRLISNAPHIGYCGEGAEWDDACNYLFGVPPENQ